MGCIINVAIYKEGSERPLLSKQCRVGNFVALRPTDKIYICALIPSYSAIYNEFSEYIKGTKSISQDPVEFADNIDLLPDSEFSPMFEVDLLKYSKNGKISIKVEDEDYSGKLSFVTST